MPDKVIIQEIADLLIKQKQTIAVAESVTAGMMQTALASGENASDYFEGGITAYNINQKYIHLEVDLEYAKQCNCVSEKTASEMAINIVRSFHSYWGIAVTGYASPVPELGIHSLHACYAIAFQEKIVEVSTIHIENMPPLTAQETYVNVILKQFKKLLGQYTN